jgi:amino acid transporter
VPAPAPPLLLTRHFGLLQATALNVTMIVGAGVFVTVPPMLALLPGPDAVLGWLAGAALMLVDSLIWCELAAMLPGSGGSYHFLREGFGRQTWGRLTAFLFIWQFLLSGPLEAASGLIALGTFANYLAPGLAAFNAAHTYRAVLPLGGSLDVAIQVSPTWVLAVAVGGLIVVLLYRRIESLGRWTIGLWLGVLAAIGWILVAGAMNFDPAKAFDWPSAGDPGPTAPFAQRLGQAMTLALYSYLGYYMVCYVGDEVRDPGRTIPRSILLSASLVAVLFVGVHLAMLGTVSWRDVPTSEEAQKSYSLPAEFMTRLYGPQYGPWAASLVTLALIGSCFASVFAALLSYSRVPYGAALDGQFFRVFGRVHPTLRIPHVSLLLVGGLTLFWTLFDLSKVIAALVTTRILEQFIAQVAAVVLLRLREPDRPRPFRMWFYPVPCGLALAGWLYVYFSAEPLFIVTGLATLAIGVAVFLAWSCWRGTWPFPAADGGDAAG